ncbi:uncharacterized protein JCM15063_000375 [Sporobolomyces koalae]|uniref:uncharacterized protein n=1 Tax=Sporobolomyces koalae TaxID=500713 RepID=UPI00317DE240
MYSGARANRGDDVHRRFKPPRPAQPVAFSVPISGGRSESDRTFDIRPSSQSHQHHVYNQDNGYRGNGRSNVSGQYGRGGNHNSHGRSERPPERYGNSSGTSTGHSWDRNGQEGFAPRPQVAKAQDVGKAYTAAPYDPLESGRPVEARTDEFRTGESRQGLQNIARERGRALATGSLGRQDFSARSPGREDLKAEQEAFAATNRRAREERQKRKMFSTSSSASGSTLTPHSTNIDSSPLKVTDKYDNEPQAPLSSLNDKLSSLISTKEGRKSDSDQGNAIDATESASDERAELLKEAHRFMAQQDKGKGKERAKDNDASSVLFMPKKKPSSKLGKLKKGGFDSPSPKKSKSSKHANPSRELRGHSPSLATQFSKQRDDDEDGDEIDALIRAAEEKAIKEKTLDNSGLSHDSDTDVDMAEEQVRGAGNPINEELDPSRLCPFCDQILPPVPTTRLVSLKNYLLARPHIEDRISARNPQARYLPIIEIASFCQLHKVEKTVIPEGMAKGYPMEIDWAALPARIETLCAPHLSAVVRGDSESRFLEQARRDWEANGGFRRSNVTAEWDSFQSEEPGYYGLRGLECIHATLRQLFTLDNPILDDDAIAPLSSDFYLRRVLIPETALCLIRDDLKLDDTPENADIAANVLRESRAFGKAAHGIIEDVHKERARADKEEQANTRTSQEQDGEVEIVGIEDRGTEPLASAPNYRQPKALQPKALNVLAPIFDKPPVPKARSGSLDLNELAEIEEAKAKSETKSKPKPKSRTSIASTSVAEQPSVKALFARQAAKEPEVVPKNVNKGSSNECSVVLDSSDIEIEPENASPERNQKKRRHSSPEKKKRPNSAFEPVKKRRASSPLSLLSPVKKRRESPPPSSPAGNPLFKKRRSKFAPDRASPARVEADSVQSRAELAKKLNDSSDLEEDIEVDFRHKKPKKTPSGKPDKKQKSNEKTTKKKKKVQDDSKGKGQGKGSTKVNRNRQAVDSSDSD